MRHSICFIAAFLSACGGQEPTADEAEEREAADGMQGNARFWDGEPIDVAKSDICLSRYPNVTQGVMRQMMAGPNWERLGPQPDLDRVLASNGLQYAAIHRRNQCEVAFTVDALVDGTSYNWRGSCPFDPSPNEPDVVLMLKLPECDWF